MHAYPYELMNGHIVLAVEQRKDQSDDVQYFGSGQAALAWVKAATDGPYHLDHNEADRPTYHIVPA